MSNYILISSAYRDRILYPNPSDFIVPFQQVQSSVVNRFDVLSTVNPISIYPVYNFCWTNFQTNSAVFTTIITGGGGSNIKLDKNVQTQLLGIIPELNTLQSVKNCENILSNFTARIKDDSGNNIDSLIIAYSPIYNTITTLEPLPFTINQTLEILNTSILNVDGNTQIVLNGDYNSLLLLDNNLYLYNITTNEISKCILDNQQGRLLCESSFTESGFTDKYLLYNTLYPFVIGSLEKFPNNQYYIESTLNQFTVILKGSGYILSEKVYLLEKGSTNMDMPFDCSLLTVKRIGPNGTIEELELSEIGCQNFKRSIYYYILPVNKRLGVEYGSVFMVDVSTAFRCKIKNNQNIRSRELRGNYFTCFLLSPLYNLFEQKLYTSPNNTFPVKIPDIPVDLYESQQLSGVTAIHNVLFINDEVIIFVQKISPILLQRFRYYEALTTLQKTSPTFKDATNFCIQSFVREGVVPLNFSGTYLTQSQMSCYEITVLNLILPNVEIDALNSLLTSGFPYVLMEISNVTMPNSGNKNVIYSNNPAVVNSTFVCSISDINDPIKSRFIKISSDGTIQTIKFSPADNLRFRILLPSGEPFKLQENDYLPPSIADPKLQIESLIELKRM